jgi:hypothetical protein
MPDRPSRAHTARVVPYFPPLRSRHVFAPEKLLQAPAVHGSRDVEPFQLKHRKVFDANDTIPERSMFTSVGSSGTPPQHGEKIPKPKGTAGKPSAGGYSLRAVLQWGERYDAALTIIAKLADEMLDPTRTWATQTSANKQAALIAVSD